MQNNQFSLVGRGRLELPTNGLKARCRTLRKSERAPENPRLMRMVNGIGGKISHPKDKP